MNACVSVANKQHIGIPFVKRNKHLVKVFIEKHIDNICENTFQALDFTNNTFAA